MNNFLPLPPDWSADGHEIDGLIGIVHWLMLALFVFWGAYFLYVLFRFRAGRNPEANHGGIKATWSKYIEIGVVVAEIVLLIGFAFPLWAKRVADPPAEADATRVRVVGQQFAWNFHYPGADGVYGRTDPNLIDEATNPLGIDRKDPAADDDITQINNLYLPVDKPVLLELSSKDVIHSFSLPYFRVKHDLIPGQRVRVWFTPVQTGSSDIACAQLCGLSHYRMRGMVHIQTAQEHAAWLREQASS